MVSSSRSLKKAALSFASSSLVLRSADCAFGPVGEDLLRGGQRLLQAADAQRLGKGVVAVLR